MRLFFVSLGAAALAAALSCGEDFEAGGTGAAPTTGAGAGQSCMRADDCEVPAAACMRADCRSGQCVNVPRTSGPAPVQTLGDCQDIVCDGQGNEVSQANDGDVPFDGEECTNDSCAGGIPMNPPVPAGSPCGNSLMCDASGNCVGCDTPADCGTQPQCASWNCSSHTCEKEPLSPGSPANHQTPGDCKLVVCDDQGMPIAQIATSDLPNDPTMGDCSVPTCARGNPGMGDAEDDTPCTVPMNGFCCGGLCEVGTCGGVGGAGGAGGN